ncbi:MAG: DNA gyrase subunit A [Candidatus Electryonea clarkiae]|nr:DNA gyrase subunit A [Candidatus Electryonea clarkiae]MDP8288979.1 DNA gyrase subunit A [Candidatus Electryonea clarkiae]
MNLDTHGQRIKEIALEEEMKNSYLDYSMSVIVSRALPDVRDGLKPVHRRILFGMRELGVTPGKKYKKSARIVGDVMGKYHPHGDSAIYDAIVRMAQDFSLRYPLVDGQGNFGSTDGDSAAAMRYTEARMAKIADEMIEDIDKETVNFVHNYDESLKEPEVLPARLPNLLLNGVSGIAVGMATNIPPHNLTEIIEAVVHLIDNPDCEIDDLMRFVTAPDFPTGGIIYGMTGVKEGYRTGRGRVIMRAKVYIEEDKRERQKIIVTELPYQVNKALLAEKIAALANEKKIEGISDIRDESDRDGTRLVIFLKKDAYGEVVLNQLFKHTQLQTTFGMNMIALDHGVPKLMNLKTILQKYVDHRHDVVLRRTNFDLRRAKEREHILEGLKIAIDNIDRIIEIIRASSGPETAKISLMEEFELTDIQAKAILDMRLSKLTGLERQKLVDELKALQELIIELVQILESPTLRMEIIKDELSNIQERFGDDRRTEVIKQYEEFTIEDMIAEEDMVVTISNTGYIKRQPITSYRRQGRGGRGKTGAKTKEEDFIEHLFIASTHEYVLFFTDRGRLHWLKVYDIPQMGRMSKGKALINILQISDEQIASFVNVKEFDDEHNILLCTRGGTVKKTNLSAYSNVRKGGIIAINVRDDDELLDAAITDGNCEVILGTSGGKAVRFRETDVRPQGRTTAGVKGVSLPEGQIVVGMVVVKRNGTLLVATDKGFGKRSEIGDYRLTKRGAKGVITLKTSDRVGHMLAIMEVGDDDDLMIITQQGVMIRLPIKDVRVIGRATQGVKLIRLDKGDQISSITNVVTNDDEDKETGDGDILDEGIEEDQAEPTVDE